MKRKYILFLLCSFVLGNTYAQTLEQARTLFSKGNYEKAKPVFQRYTKSSPSNGNYNFWYGVCCLKTGDPEAAVKPLEMAVKEGFRADSSTWDKHSMLPIALKKQ